MKNTHGLRLFLISTIFVISITCLNSPLPAADTDRSPININLIIDGSEAFSGVRDEITSWLFERLDQILVDGDTVTVWNTENEARTVYSGTVNNSTERDIVKNHIREISASGDRADFSGALRQAASRQNSGFSYTLLISTSSESLASVLASPQANLLRYSRIEEFSSWRAVVIGLDIDSRVRRAAAAFIGS